MREKFENLIEDIVDSSKPKVIDRIAYAIMGTSLIAALYLFISTLDIIRTPIIKVHSIAIYSVFIIMTGGLFFFTMLGDKTNKPVYRPKLFLFSSIILAILTYSLLAEIFNYAFTLIIDKLLEVTEVPSFLIHTNVRIFTVFVPILIVVLVFSKSISIAFNKSYSKELLEYQIDPLTRNVYKVNDNKVYVKLCEDIETGKPVIVPEEITFRHKLIDGSSGSGKTALNIRPDLAQLFYRKSYFREKLKELTFEALEKGLCFINKPITNKYLNDNFSMDFITVIDDRKEEFLELFKDYIIGVRKSERRLFENKYTFNSRNPLLVEIPIIFHSDIKKLIVNIKVYENNLISDEIPIEFKKDINTLIEKDNYTIQVVKKAYSRKVKNEDGEEEIEYIQKEIGESESTKKLYSEYLEVTITPNTDNYSNYSFNVIVDEKGNGKIIYKDVGVTVVAPDGGLAKDTYEIAEENGIYVYKIDPKKEEIDKGNIAKFNPLLVGTPEKAGDIVSSILIAMEQNSGKDSNPYFTNASIRAVRNVIILLKVMYPKIHNGKNPILTDALEILNNFNLVIPYVEEMKKDSYLRVRWKSVIDYFETSFYPQPYDEASQRPLRDTHLGSKTKKTEEAIGGMINQLDNFLGREEIRYILCDREESLNLSEVLEKGYCLAISTRQSELGDVLGKAFALMIILSIQNAVLGRYSEDENPEIPFHLTIDEFPFYVNDQTKVFFTFARKYKCAMTVAIQNLSQLEEVSNVFRQVVFTNCTTKIVLPGANVEDREYFSKAFGIVEEFETMTSVSSNPVITENAKYSESARGQLREKNKVSEQELAELKFKRCYYTTVDKKGNTVTGKGYMDFVKLTDNNTIKPKYYDFEKYVKEENNNIDKSNTNNINKTTQSKFKNEDKREISINNLEADLMDYVNEIEDIESFENSEGIEFNVEEEVVRDKQDNGEFEEIHRDSSKTTSSKEENNKGNSFTKDISSDKESVPDVKEETSNDALEKTFDNEDNYKHNGTSNDIDDLDFGNIDFDNLNVDFSSDNINVLTLPNKE